MGSKDNSVGRRVGARIRSDNSCRARTHCTALPTRGIVVNRSPYIRRVYREPWRRRVFRAAILVSCLALAGAPASALAALLHARLLRSIPAADARLTSARSEERRVGQEWRSG